MTCRKLKSGFIACLAMVALLPLLLLPPEVRAGGVTLELEAAEAAVLDPQREELVAYLQTKGAPRQEATEAVLTLSDQEVLLLLENREMIKPGGDLSDTEIILIVLGVVIVVLLVILIASPSFRFSMGIG